MASGHHGTPQHQQGVGQVSLQGELQAAVVQDQGGRYLSMPGARQDPQGTAPTRRPTGPAGRPFPRPGNSPSGGLDLGHKHVGVGQAKGVRDLILEVQ